MVRKAFHNGRNQTSRLFYTFEKAPSPDGLTIAFLQECSDMVQQEVADLLQDFHSNGQIPSSLNPTFITLIPKKSAAIRIQEFRPKSLVTAPYKIIAKVLSNKICAVLHEVVDGNQYAFIEGRNNLDSILIANECMEDYKRRKEKELVLKLDLEKAYDKTDSDFLECHG